MKETKVYLNSWYFYNEGHIGFGWMTPQEARDFMEEHEDDTRYEEWFIADIENYLGLEIDNLEYCNVEELLDTIEELESMDEWEKDETIAVMEYLGCDISEAIR